ncbi:thioredoxin family protein [Nocardia brasiliensis]|uniref:thioredoxin family protein n=1 Tax=Nocardia brasiliensis TaxID=37326 RepID=UPI003794D6DA
MAAEVVIREIVDDQFATTLTRAGAVVVEFYATWCGACRRLAPVLDSVAAEFGGRAEFVKINADDNPAAVAAHEISTTPTLIAFLAGQPVARLVGAHPEPVLREWLTQALPTPADEPKRSVALLWAPVDACTLPTAQQPLREAEFADLFATALRAVTRLSRTRLRLELDPAIEATARDLARRESSCCSFFSFDFTSDDSTRLWMDIDVPPARVEVLDGLAAHAETARTAA